MNARVFSIWHLFKLHDAYVCRTLADGLQVLDPFIRFVVCDPCCTPAFQQLRSSLMSTLCLKCIDNLPLIQYLLQLIALMPVVVLVCYYKHMLQPHAQWVTIFSLKLKF